MLILIGKKEGGLHSYGYTKDNAGKQVDHLNDEVMKTMPTRTDGL